jgi:hypothetical protein
MTLFSLATISEAFPITALKTAVMNSANRGHVPNEAWISATDETGIPPLVVSDSCAPCRRTPVSRKKIQDALSPSTRNSRLATGVKRNEQS